MLLSFVFILDWYCGVCDGLDAGLGAVLPLVERPYPCEHLNVLAIGVMGMVIGEAHGFDFYN